MNHTTQRVVTGHNADGKAVILQDGPAPKIYDQRGQTDTFNNFKHQVINETFDM